METPDNVDDFFEHHGIKGQKWGVRRDLSRSSNVTVRDKKKKLKTYGGVGRPAHPDAVAARTSGQIAKKSGVKALSNQELQAYNNRLNLEQNYSRLTQQDKSPGRKFINKMLGRKDVQTGFKESGKAVLNSKRAKRRIAIGAAALAFRLPVK